MTGGDANLGAGPAENARRLILNPTSGDENHTKQALRFAADYGFQTVETECAGPAVDLATQAAADGVDGTVHEVVQGLVAADALDLETLIYQ